MAVGAGVALASAAGFAGALAFSLRSGWRSTTVVAAGSDTGWGAEATGTGSAAAAGAAAGAGGSAFAICAADGTQVALLADKDLAWATVRQHEMEPVSVH